MSDHARNEIFYNIGKIEGMCLTVDHPSEVTKVFKHILDSIEVMKDALVGKRDPYFATPHDEIKLPNGDPHITFTPCKETT